MVYRWLLDGCYQLTKELLKVGMDVRKKRYGYCRERYKIYIDSMVRTGNTFS